LLPAPSRADRSPGTHVDPSAGDDLLARAHAAITTPPQTHVAAPPREPHAEMVRLPMACSMTGGTFVVIAERNGDRLRFVGHEMPRTRQDAEYRPGLLSGDYKIETAADWMCPICRSSASQQIWTCHCTEFFGALHCGGMRGRARFCACGRLEERQLVTAESLQVRGVSVAATPDQTRSGTRPHGQPLLKQVTHVRDR
jgi:hypothetical protein